MSRARRLIGLGALALLAGCGSDAVSPALSAPDARADAGHAALDGSSIDSGTDRGTATATDGPSEQAADLAAAADGAAVTTSDVADAGDAAASLDAPPRDLGGSLRCNGHEELCDRRFDQVVFPATHNAMGNADDGWFAPNQEHGIPRQLQDGIRAMLLDTHPFRGDLYLCHSLCNLGSRLLVDGLRDIATFLRANPHEVVALLIEDRISAADSERAFMQSGLIDWVYVHPAGAAWPTLRTMIASGHRLLVTAENGRPPPAWYHHLWDLASDTPYAFQNPQEFSCRPNRGLRSNDLFLVNHWVENPLPSPASSRAVNGSDVLLARARQCQAESGKVPNFVAVNHYATGDLFSVVRQLNGLPP